ncbi:uncharacterized protein BDW47DRAFT_122315 [Aspergillus candidus]|uniref:Methyltransferase type 11 domain-containing protein n=1 Tax=Aspergillus candidus TaxID=41067 RepID=A0A2I2FML0_ASPCN|nr:hypothetical protein BDW47DRAFT_122315 [Aspergillus candidus]PLB41870.1 hypothetical protein BDW47DRAFT_122315 [Aspergillus candidus]
MALEKRLLASPPPMMLRSEASAGPINSQVANAIHLPFDGASFDRAYAIESLLHMSDKRTALT